MDVVVLRDRVSPNASPDELDVLLQAEAICEALERMAHSPRVMEFCLDLQAVREALGDIRPAFVFNLVESVEGQGRLIHLSPTLLEMMGLPYTGSDALAIYTTSNKLLAKKLLRAAGIATPPWLAAEDLKENAPRPGRAYIIKSQWEHASIGLSEASIIRPEGQSGPLLKELAGGRARLRDEGFAEEFIEGREFNLSILANGGRPAVLPPGEIQFLDFPKDKPKIVGYEAKWVEDSFEYGHTPRTFEFDERDRPLLDELSRIALACWSLFGLRGYARVDFRVDNDGKPWVLEINVNPCLSPDAGYAAAVTKAGLTYQQAIERIVTDSFPPN